MFLKNAPPSDCQVHPMVVVHQAAASSDRRLATSPAKVRGISLLRDSDTLASFGKHTAARRLCKFKP